MSFSHTNKYQEVEIVEEKWKIKYTSKIQKRRMMRKFYDVKLRQKVSEHMPHLGDIPEEFCRKSNKISESR